MNRFLDEANAYLKSSILPLKYKNSFHYDVPIGWMNDPYGLVFFKGVYHVFYQFEPYGEISGPKYWGHATTTDFICWNTLPVALAPDMPYDKDGCWSGSAVVKDGRLRLYYTGNLYYAQEQCMASSENGITFQKDNDNPVIPLSMMPRNGAAHSFRDPFVFRIDDKYYCLIGSKNVDEDCGQILLYRLSADNGWSYKGTIWKDDYMEDPGICECPNYVCIGNTGVLVYSRNFVPTQGKRFRNFGDSIAYVGTIDPDKPSFNGRELTVLDYGFDFYAAQTAVDRDRIVLLAWLQMWEMSYPSKAEGWVGTLSFPRELRVENGKILQTPVRELENFCRLKKSEYSIGTVCLGPPLVRLVIEADAEDPFFVLINGEGGEICFSYSSGKREFSLRRSGNIPRSQTPYEENADERCYENDQSAISLDILIDTSAFEAFINHGKAVMSSAYYITEAQVTIHSMGKIKYSVFEINTSGGRQDENKTVCN